VLGLLAVTACAADASSVENERSEAGVQAVEKRWSEAFVRGETAYLNQLLSDDYVSVNGSGMVRTKADVIELSRKYAASNPEALPDLPQSPVSIVGDAAIVTHDNPGERSVDVFYYRDGRWHAWYSQHTRK
jgi:hypothetical protein